MEITISQFLFFAAGCIIGGIVVWHVKKVKIAIAERIKQAQQSYDEARRKFSDGTGNVIRQAQMLKTLGVKPTKRLPAQWVEDASIEPPQMLTTESASTHETEAQTQEDAKDSRTDDRQNKEP